MHHIDNKIHLSEERSSLGSSLLLILFTIIGFVIIGPTVGLLVAMFFYEGNFFDFATILQPPFDDPAVRIPLFIAQGFATLIGLIVIPWLFLRSYEKKSFQEFFKIKIPYLIPSLVVFFIIVSFMGVNAIFIEWNQAVQFPDFMRGFEIWAQEREQMAAQATKFLTQFDSFPSFLLGFLVIAILPAIGEELVFRGFLQNYLHGAFSNVHVAIWLSAILFSAIHIQFYGFVPRMLLGALFGYLYYWSGNLWIPIVAHLFHNGFTIVMVYLYQLGTLKYDIESATSTPWYIVLLFSVITFFLLRYFYRYFINYHSRHDNLEERIQDKRAL
ncbi:MAG: CPBP family intramembrane glutamic endopeptidase [Candidatus Cyclobacteriaceae bacterium M2_1C_046]